MSKKILFIANPQSGNSKLPMIADLLKTHVTDHEWQLETTKYPGHAYEIAEKSKGSADVIVAIGGDGTINEIASALVNSTVALGIVPKGSGNGLSRFLGIPRRYLEALKVVRYGKIKEVDTMSLNGHRFFNMAGIGFDAHIAHLFKDYGARGFISYAKLVYREFGSYEGINVRLESSSNVVEQKAFIVSFANSSQYGNNAYIAPGAVIDDGLTDVCILKKFSAMNSLPTLFRLFNKSLVGSRGYETFKTKEIEISCEHEMKAHVDGEPIKVGKNAKVTVYPKNLRVLVP